MNAIARKLQTLPMDDEPVETEMDESYKVYDLNKKPDEILVYREDDGAFVAEAPWLDRFLRSINFDDFESMRYFQKTLERRGVIEALEKKGLKPGDTVRLGDIEFIHDPEED